VTSGGVNSDKEGIFLTASCCSFPGSELSKYGLRIVQTTAAAVEEKKGRREAIKFLKEDYL
jgi:hypothetical protein